jgi:hypothetical protein
MNLIVKLIVLACIAFGFHYAVKQVVNTTVTAQLGDQPWTPPLPTVEPEALRRAMEVGRAVDTTAQRAVIEDASRRMEELNRTMPIPMPPTIPGMPRH